MSKLGTLKMYLRKSEKLDDHTDLYAHTVRLLDGGELDLETLRGRPTLIVNTASKCGLTPQYRGLQSLHDRFHAQGLTVLGFPSGDFADQEFDTVEEIGAFCQQNYGVTFSLTERTSVRQDPSQLWQDLISQPTSAAPSWNFTKYLVGRDGRLIAMWGSRTEPEDPEIISAIEAALAD